MDDFLKGYAGCALWSSTGDDGEPLDGAYGIEDLAPATLEAMEADCRSFREAYGDLLAQAGDDGRNGHDFWLTRNHHGADFWDRGCGSVGAKLTEAAHAWGSCDLYVGDDGLIYC